MEQISYKELRTLVQNDLGIDIQEIGVFSLYKETNGAVRGRKHRNCEGGGCFSEGFRITYKNYYVQI